MQLDPDLLFDCSRVLEYAKIRTGNLAKQSSLLRPLVNENLSAKARSTIYQQISSEY